MPSLRTWITTSVLAGLVGLVVSAETPPFLAGVIPSGDESNVAGYAVGWAVVIAGTLTGATFAAFSQRAMWGLVPDARLWITASAVAGAVTFTAAWILGGGAFGDGYHHAVPHAMDGAGLVGAAMFGLGLGVAQAFASRGGMRFGASWALANAAGFVVGWAIAGAAPVGGVPAHFVGGLIVGLVLGLFTWSALRLVGAPASVTTRLG